MTATHTCPCRADHVGSLLRPRMLRDGYRALQRGEIDEKAFRAIQDQAVREAVEMQEKVGLDALTDGEFRRRSWFAGFVDAVEGLTHKDTLFRFVEGDEASIPVPVPHAEAPIRRTGGISTDEFRYMKGITKGRVKITLPSPSVMHFFRGNDGIDRTVYPDIEQFWADLIAIYRAEIRELGELGCTYLQLDEVPIALLCDPNIRARIATWGWNWETLLDRYIDAVNHAIAERPADMTIAMHLCRGNFRGHWIGSGGYEPVAERLFQKANVDVYLLEFDSERAGDFSPLRFLPPHKSVVLGLVSSKTPELEKMDDLRARIDAASAYVPAERLGVSPQCGFGTTVGGAPMDEEQQFRKLALVAETARSVWG